MFLKAVLGLIAALVIGAFALALPEPTPISACSGGWGNFEDYAKAADAVAIVQVLSAGDSRNPAPSVTPIPLIPGLSLIATPVLPGSLPPPTIPTASNGTLPSIAPTATATATAASFGVAPSPADIQPVFTGRQVAFDLTGFGAHLRVEQVIAGTLPSEFDVDATTRGSLEKQIRMVEANPRVITPCPLGFGMLTYKPGERLLLFLRSDDNDKSQWDGMVRLTLNGNAALASFVDPGSAVSYPILTVSAAVRGAFFADMLAENLPANSEGETPKMSDLWSIKADSVPVTRLVAAVQAIRSGAPILPLRIPIDPAPSLSPAVPRLRPPDTGDGGLRSLID